MSDVGGPSTSNRPNDQLKADIRHRASYTSRTVYTQNNDGVMSHRISSGAQHSPPNRKAACIPTAARRFGESCKLPIRVCGQALSTNDFGAFGAKRNTFDAFVALLLFIVSERFAAGGGNLGGGASL